MLQLRCTAKVREYYKLENFLDEPRTSQTLLGDWYANIFMIGKQKCLIFMNEPTLLSFVFTKLRRGDGKKLVETLMYGLQQILQIDGFSEDDFIRIVDEIEEVQFTKTASKSLMGNLNDLVHMYRTHILLADTIDSVSLGNAIYSVNRTPQRNLDWQTPIEVVRQRIQTGLPHIKKGH